MSFNRSLRPLALVLLPLLAGVGCGHKADPFPPPLENPALTTDLSVQQRGQAAVLSFTYPTTTVSGGLLATLERIEVYRTKKDISGLAGNSDEETAAATAEDATETGTETGTDTAAALPTEEDAETSAGVEADAAAPASAPEPSLEILGATEAMEFVATAVLVESFNAEAIEQATEGARLSFRIELGEAAHEQTAHTFAIKTYAGERLASAFSNLVTLVQRDSPPPPTDFQVTAEADGIRLTWLAAEGETEPIAFRVYRRSAQSRLYGPPLSRLASDSTEYLDRSAEFGQRYIYAVTSLSHENPIVESFFGGEREIDYADRFAPSPPTELIALAEAGRVRLLWTASPQDDVVGYVVFRRQAGSDFRRLTDKPVVDVEFNDRSVEPGATYDYQVAAVDRSGNQSEPGTSVLARVP